MTLSMLQFRSLSLDSRFLGFHDLRSFLASVEMECSRECLTEWFKAVVADDNPDTGILVFKLSIVVVNGVRFGKV